MLLVFLYLNELEIASVYYALRWCGVFVLLWQDLGLLLYLVCNIFYSSERDHNHFLFSTACETHSAIFFHNRIWLQNSKCTSSYLLSYWLICRLLLAVSNFLGILCWSPRSNRDKPLAMIPMVVATLIYPGKLWGGDRCCAEWNTFLIETISYSEERTWI